MTFHVNIGKVFLVGFGFATPFKSPTGVHVSPTSGGGKLIGTRQASHPILSHFLLRLIVHPFSRSLHVALCLQRHPVLAARARPSFFQPSTKTDADLLIDISDLESLGYVLLSLLVPQLPWAALARHMDVLFLHRGRTQQVAVEASAGLADMVKRVREAKEGVIRACQAGRPAMAVGGGGVEGRGVIEAVGGSSST